MPEATWIDALAARSGPLGKAGWRFWQQLHESESAPASDTEGWCWLAQVVDEYSYADSAIELSEEAFIDGAGAFFALLVLHAFENASYVGRDHRHRLKLGNYGCINPFAIVEQAIASESPKRDVLQGLRRVERECCQQGEVSSLLSCFVAELARARPDLAVVDSFEWTLYLRDGTEVDLARVADATRGQSSAAQQMALRKLIAMLPGSMKTPGDNHSELMQQLMPRVIGDTFIDELKTTRGDVDLCYLPWPDTARLKVALVAAHPGRNRFLRLSECESLKPSLPELMRVALDNLRQRSEGMQLRPYPQAPALMQLRLGDGFDAARVLLESCYQQARQQLGPSFWCALPHRDLLLFASQQGDAPAQLQRITQDLYARAPHRIGAQPILIDQPIALMES